MSYDDDMSLQQGPLPKMRGAVLLPHPHRPLLPPSGVPHASPTGLIEEREVRDWPWLWRKRTVSVSPGRVWRVRA